MRKPNATLSQLPCRARSPDPGHLAMPTAASLLPPGERFYIACAVGAVDLCLEMLASGADPNLRTASMDIIDTPLHAAAWNGHEAVVRLLIESGARVDDRDSGGHTPLHSAACQGRSGVCRILLDAGADPTSKTRDGDTPLDLAGAQGHADAARSLIEISDTRQGAYAVRN